MSAVEIETRNQIDAEFRIQKAAVLKEMGAILRGEKRAVQPGTRNTLVVFGSGENPTVREYKL